MGRWRVLREPTVPILLLACVVHAVRRNLFDLLLFAGTAVLIVADAWRAAPARTVNGSLAARQGAPERGRPGGRPRPASPGWAAWLAVIAFAVLAGPLPRDGGAIQVVLVAVGVGALVVVVTGRRPAAGPRHRSPRGWPIWAALGVLACLWELTSFAIQQNDPAVDAAHPTASDLIGPLLGSWPGRMVFLALWATAGVWLLRRLAGVAQDTDGDRPGRRDAVGGSEIDDGVVGPADRPEQAAGGTEAAR